ncbi:MAG: glycosyltransferase family 39 protein, partial [Candidatus Nanohaloarchaea archaeon]
MVETLEWLQGLEPGDRYATGVVVLFGLTLSTISVAAWNTPLTWDSSVYLAMGKWIFSSGEFGFWENLRPPLLPLLLGTLWKAGVPYHGYYRLLSTAVSTAGLATVYYASRDLFGSREALVATALLASSHAYIFFTVDPLTGIPASILVFLGLYLATDDRYLAGGIVLGTAFLTRFPAALAGPAAVIYILIEGYSREDYRGAARNAAALTAGFFAVAGAYLALQY